MMVSRCTARVATAALLVPIVAADLFSTFDTNGDGKLSRIEFQGISTYLMKQMNQTFSPPGGTIRVTAQRDRKTVVVTVDDDGPGIPPGKEEAIFQRFYTERPQGEKFGTHSGLGLSISQQIVKAHEGTILASNRLGADGKIMGARFTVTLPAA